MPVFCAVLGRSVPLKSKATATTRLSLWYGHLVHKCAPREAATLERFGNRGRVWDAVSRALYVLLLLRSIPAARAAALGHAAPLLPKLAGASVVPSGSAQAAADAHVPACAAAAAPPPPSPCFADAEQGKQGRDASIAARDTTSCAGTAWQARKASDSGLPAFSVCE